MNIKDYLKYYIGCRVLADDKDYGDFLGAALVPNEVGQIYYDIHLDEWDEGEIMPFNDDTSEDCRVKPLLRRLEDMTEEEALAFIGIKPGDRGIRNYVSHDKYGVYWKGAGVNSAHMSFELSTAAQFHYLLFFGFDIFGLIDAGLAIDAKTINT